MIEIIPTIIAKDFKELQEKVRRVEPYVDWIQLDIMDGQFVDNSTWSNPAELKKLETEAKLEAHLMIKNPEDTIEQWINSGVKRIIIHFESTRYHRQLIDKIKKAGLEVGLAINPQTPIEVVDDFIPDLDLVLVMTVQPGRGGQKLIADTLNKIEQLRETYPNVNIEVDGGINSETASQVIQAGANLLASGSAIFNSGNIEETIKKLKSLQ